MLIWPGVVIKCQQSIRISLGAEFSRRNISFFILFSSSTSTLVDVVAFFVPAIRHILFCLAHSLSTGEFIPNLYSIPMQHHIEQAERTVNFSGFRREVSADIDLGEKKGDNFFSFFHVTFPSLGYSFAS